MFRTGIRLRITWVLFFSLFGSANLAAAVVKVTSVDVRDNLLTIELAGKPEVQTDTFHRGDRYYLVISFKRSVLIGAPRHLELSVGGPATVDVTQYTVRPDVVHAVIRSSRKVNLPVQTLYQGADHYLVTLALRSSPHLKVFLDVGHGGYDPGGTGPDGLPESFVNLDVAKHLAKILRSDGVDVELDRTTNTFVSLSRRVELANESSADLFLGLYCNASSDRTIHGTTTYYYHTDSADFARYLESHVARSLGLTDNGVMRDNLYVIRHTTTRMPDVLIEYAYISNFHEEELLSRPSFRSRIAAALADAVIKYFVHRTTPPKSAPSPGKHPSTGPSGLEQTSGSAQITSIGSPDGSVTIESTGRPTVESFTFVHNGERYFVVNLKNAVLPGQERSFRVGPPFSAEVSIAQFSVTPDVVRVAVREEYQNSYRVESLPAPGGNYLTTIYPVAN